MQKPVPHTMLEFICDENIVGHSFRCIFSRMISINHRNRKGTFYDVQYIYFFSSYFDGTTGNVFVIAAIILERNLQNVANYLVASLAVADLFVACLVMPLGAVYEVSNQNAFPIRDRHRILHQKPHHFTIHMHLGLIAGYLSFYLMQF